MLSKEKAIALCAVGPTLRASGVPMDVRKDDPYAVYDEIPFEVSTADSCDVLGRAVVRVKELMQSYNIIEFLLKNLPDGPDHGQGAAQGQGERGLLALRGAARRERPLRQEQRLGQARAPEGARPTLANYPATIEMLKNGFIADIPLIFAAIDPCICCAERLVQLDDARSGESKVLTFSQLRAMANERDKNINFKKKEISMAILKPILYILVYPGLLFLLVYSTFCEWFDRKLYARMQNRIGPLHTGRSASCSRSPTSSSCSPRKTSCRKRPTSACSAPCRSSPWRSSAPRALYLPVWHYSAAPSFISFPGDLIVVVYLLTLPTLIFFLAGWHSTNFFSAIGGVRVLTMLFGYEIPLLLALLSPAVLAGSWRILEIAVFLPEQSAADAGQPDRLCHRPDRPAGQAGARALRHPPRRDRDRRRPVHRVLGQEAGLLPAAGRHRDGRGRRPDRRRLPGRLPGRAAAGAGLVRPQDAGHHLPAGRHARRHQRASASTR